HSGLGMEKVEKLADAEILFQGEAVIGRDRPAVVLQEELANAGRRRPVEPEREQGGGGLRREVPGARRDDLFENLSDRGRRREGHVRIIPLVRDPRQPKSPRLSSNAGPFTAAWCGLSDTNGLRGSPAVRAPGRR